MLKPIEVRFLKEFYQRGNAIIHMLRDPKIDIEAAQLIVRLCEDWEAMREVVSRAAEMRCESVIVLRKGKYLPRRECCYVDCSVPYRASKLLGEKESEDLLRALPRWKIKELVKSISAFFS